MKNKRELLEPEMTVGGVKQIDVEMVEKRFSDRDRIKITISDSIGPVFSFEAVAPYGDDNGKIKTNISLPINFSAGE